jgi:hypothetical protein
MKSPMYKLLLFCLLLNIMSFRLNLSFNISSIYVYKWNRNDILCMCFRPVNSIGIIYRRHSVVEWCIPWIIFYRKHTHRICICKLIFYDYALIRCEWACNMCIKPSHSLWTKLYQIRISIPCMMYCLLCQCRIQCLCIIYILLYFVSLLLKSKYYYSGKKLVLDLYNLLYELFILFRWCIYPLIVSKSIWNAIFWLVKSQTYISDSICQLYNIPHDRDGD